MLISWTRLGLVLLIAGGLASCIPPAFKEIASFFSSRKLVFSADFNNSDDEVGGFPSRSPSEEPEGDRIEIDDDVSNSTMMIRESNFFSKKTLNFLNRKTATATVKFISTPLIYEDTTISFSSRFYLDCRKNRNTRIDFNIGSNDANFIGAFLFDAIRIRLRNDFSNERTYDLAFMADNDNTFLETAGQIIDCDREHSLTLFIDRNENTATAIFSGHNFTFKRIPRNKAERGDYIWDEDSSGRTFGEKGDAVALKLVYRNFCPPDDAACQDEEAPLLEFDTIKIFEHSRSNP